LRQGCALSPALFNIYIDEIPSKLDDANIHPRTLRNRNVSGLLFAGDLAVRTTASIGIQRVINSIKEYCEEWKLKINTNKTKIVVFKKGRKLSKYENWKLGGEEIEVANEIKYLGIILDDRGKWEKEKRQIRIRGKTTLNSINVCLARASNMGINILEQLYVSLIESRMMTGRNLGTR
jgi:hypothetical protein